MTGRLPTATPNLTISLIREALSGLRFQLCSELDLQEGVAKALTDAGIAFEREAMLDARDRVDFLVDGVAMELKVQGTLRSVASQLRRYARHPEVSGLLLVTTVARHGFGSGEIDGKPAASVVILRGIA